MAGRRRLYDLKARLATKTDHKVALDEILSAACEFIHTDRGCLQLVSDDGQRLELFAHRGYDDATSPFINHFRHAGFEPDGDVPRRRCGRPREDSGRSPIRADHGV